MNKAKYKVFFYFYKNFSLTLIKTMYYDQTHSVCY
jgi:hypothetical protein